MTLSLGMITFDSADAVTIAHWWATAFDGKVLTENDGWFCQVDINQPVRLGFQKVDTPTPGKNRIHLDLMSSDAAADLAKLTAAGATIVGEHEMQGFGWTVLADPDGNQFCIAQHG